MISSLLGLTGRRFLAPVAVLSLSVALAPLAWGIATPKPTATPSPQARPSPGVSPEPQERVPGEIVTQSVSGQVNWSTGRITTSGGGAPPAKGSPAQRRLMAERAALADAYRNLAEIMHGVHVSSETVVEDFVTRSDTIRTQVKGLVKGATITHKRLMSDGSAEVDVEVSLYGRDGLMGVMADSVLHKTQRPAIRPNPFSLALNAAGTPAVAIAATPAWQVATTGPLEPWSVASTAYTGVVMDVHGLGLEPAMSPAILSPERRELYLGTLPVDPEIVINLGVVEYTGNMDQASHSQRAGANPLVLRAQGVGGRLKADITLDEATTQTLLNAEQAGHFLVRAAVVIVM